MAKRHSASYDSDSIVEWFDPSNEKHIKAYKYFHKYGSWEKSLWDAELWKLRLVRDWEGKIAAKIAMHFVNNVQPPAPSVPTAPQDPPCCDLDSKNVCPRCRSIQVGVGVGLREAATVIVARKDKEHTTPGVERTLDELLALIRKHSCFDISKKAA